MAIQTETIYNEIGVRGGCFHARGEDVDGCYEQRHGESRVIYTARCCKSAACLLARMVDTLLTGVKNDSRGERHVNL